MNKPFSSHSSPSNTHRGHGGARADRTAAFAPGTRPPPSGGTAAAATRMTTGSSRLASKLAPPGEFLNRLPLWGKHLVFFNLLAAASLLFLPGSLPAQSLWRDDISRPMFADKRASAVGDIVTIAVQESTTASKNNKTATSKETGVDASISSFLFSPGASSLLTKGGQFPALKFDAKNSFNGGGTIDNSEKIVAYVAARVIDVLPNRNLVIEGRRETAFSGEQQTIVLRGVIRWDDISANNTVFSYNIADASIHIISRGNLADTQRKGWFTRVWDKFTPF